MTINASLIVADVVEWLHDGAIHIENPVRLIGQLATRLRDAGVPVDRVSTNISVLHPIVRAESALWTSDGETELRRYKASPDLERLYDESPLKQVFLNNKTVHRSIGKTPAADEFAILSDLRAGGYTDYAAVPMPFSDGSTKMLTAATKDPAGFTKAHIAVLETVVRPLGLICELQTLKRSSRTMLETYVGKRAGRRVLEGTIKRGEGETISAVVGFADLRGFTRLSNTLPAEDLVILLNNYFGAITSAVEAHGGEVLKFIGDEVMAVFPYSCETTAREAARQALMAAGEAVEKIARINRDCCDESPRIRVGIGLHAGDVFFGNVGAETRLDFTVIGPTVNLASRIAGLSRDLEHDILVSQTIADMMGCHAGYGGRYPVKGFDEPVSIFEPTARMLGEDGNWCAEVATDRALEKN
ncbi:adenylate/guanylate cyclase domain-containing protein [Stappia sp. GBMRC 2046]|uniref:Adenylate/guanylate cyclase domain-containing protein n=1 Tax=Stappia sediminis TaxID=2692190 RepID=A0A7X3LS89_9HYPH|nr:adenylate/guanylate cyclase domain-containing protein [Stappia sediminis]